MIGRIHSSVEFLSSDDRNQIWKYRYVTNFTLTTAPGTEIFQGMFDIIINYIPIKYHVQLWSYVGFFYQECKQALNSYWEIYCPHPPTRQIID